MVVTVEASEVDNLEKYKSYIQRRRVRSDSSENGLIPRTDAKKDTTGTDDSFKTKPESDMDDVIKDTFKEDSSESTFTGQESGARGSNASNASNLHRTDPGLYRKLYGSHKLPNYLRQPSYAGSLHGGSNQAEIRDNRATVLALKIIKQALACFALLGVIVLMQQRTDMDGVLSFVKKHLIDSNIETQNLLSGVENIIKECSRFLGGSP